jgi:hypothetical protein
MLVPHINLKYESTIHCYGALSTTIRKKFGWIQAEEKKSTRNILISDGEESEFVRVRKRNWASLIRKVWLADPELCPRCGGRLKVIAAISSPAQDDVIEKILRSKNLWDPPWLKKRPVRGPPSVAALESSFSAGVGESN